ncbi:MAG: hypothetical protein H0V17_19125 [Deltaproteobacteria bacterium]|nr:hypothetical protein [Deltaproteobacteria bacterium]
MKLATSSLWLIALAATAATLPPRTADAWAIGSQINIDGCHEPITAEALRLARAKVATAPVVDPTRDEAALIAGVLFAPPKDFIDDLAGMTLLLAVRDNDLKGINPLSSFKLIQVHGDPETQDEHCIRGPDDDGPTGDQAALTACRDFIRTTATAALDGLDAAGMVDSENRLPFEVYVSFAGQVKPELPLFYIRMGTAMHALEDSFAHMYRTEDGMRVTTALNWIDLVSNIGLDEVRDGPPHRAELDRCWENDAVLARNYELSILASSELLTAALDPALTREQKIAAFDEITARYLTFEPGCDASNDFCSPPEAAVTSTTLGCSASGGVAIGGGTLLLVLAVAWLLIRRRGNRPRSRFAPVLLGGLLGGFLVGFLATRAHADDEVPPPTPAPNPIPAADAPAPAPVAPVDPAAPVAAEPGRDIKTITAAEVTSVREDKKLGSRLGFTAVSGASLIRGAAMFGLGARFRLNEKWLVGLNLGWNPWISTAPLDARAGVGLVYATLIRRFPMRFDRVNLRTSLHLGVSTLMFDVFGAPKYSTGPYIAFSPLGIDYDLGRSVRLVIDPAEFALPVPLAGQLPLYYEQVRFMVGLQIGA